MNLTSFYQVEILHGKLGTDQNYYSKKFENSDLKQARRDALSYAFEMAKVYSSATDSPALVRETPVLIPMPIHTSVSVSFVMHEKISYQIYGEAIHDTLFALVEEASYYEKKNLIASGDLIEILQNTDEQDMNNPPFELAAFTEEMPDFEYVVVKVLPYQLGDIIRETQYG